MIIDKIFLGVKENIFEKIINFIIRFLEPIIFLNFLSLSKYGEWLIIFALPFYLTISDLGFNTVITNEINMLIKKQKYLISNYLLKNLLSLITFFGIILGFVLFFLLTNSNFINFKYISIFELKLTLFFLIIFIIINQINGCLLRSIAATGFYYMEVRLSYLAKIIEIIFILFCLIFSDKFYFIALGILSSRLLLLIIIIFYLKKKIKWINKKKFFNLRIFFIKKFLYKSLLSCSFPLGQAIKVQLSTIFIGITLGPAYVVIINTYLTICRISSQFANIADGILKLEFAKLFIEKKINTLILYYSKNLYMTFFFSLFFTIILFIFGEAILQLWLSNKVFFNSEVFNILLLYSMMSTMFIPIVNILTSTNNFQNLSYIFLVTNILTAISISLFAKYGLTTVSLCYLFFEIILVFLSLILSLRLLKIKPQMLIINFQEMKITFYAIFNYFFKRI